MGIFFASKAAMLGYSIEITKKNSNKVVKLYDNKHGGYCFHPHARGACTVSATVLLSGEQFSYNIYITRDRVISQFDGYNI